MTPEFIQQTALDYDMDVEDVKRVYVETNFDDSFYDKLEEFIEARRHRINNGLEY